MTDRQAYGAAPAISSESHGRPRADDQRVLSGIVLINRNGLSWCDVPREYGPHTTLYNRRSERGGLLRIMEGLSVARAMPQTILVDATYLEARRSASSLPIKMGLGRLVGRTKGGINAMLLAAPDAKLAAWRLHDL